FIIGVVHRLMATPWAFLVVFFLSLWMPGRRGTVISAVFNLALILMIPLTDVEVFTTHREFLIRFHLALFLFSLMAHKSTTIRKNYLSNLFKARAETERSEQKYKALSDRLMKEIEHRDRIEKRLHHAIKMETVGRVAAGVAHDLNNILSGIVTYPDYMLLDLDEDDPIRESLETIKTSGMRAATIVDDLLTLSRRGVAVAEPLDLNRLLQSYLESPEHLQLMAAFDTVSLTVEYEEGNGGAVVGSPVHLAKTLMNLIANAVESIQGEGEVAISIRFEDLSKPEPIANPVQGHRIIPPGDYMVFSVSDTGIGIAPKDLESVFEPFYTRKQMGRSGTGLGMAVVLGTVNDHKGFIQMTSIPGKGTRISLYFPATSGASYGDASPVSEGIEALMGNNEKILVVDDEPVQLNIAEKLLTRLGYAVHCCPSGEACLEFTGKYPVDLVILDIIMEPGMDGVSACRKLLAARPDQKVLFVTGYSDTATLEEAGKLSGGPCLFKPYTLEDMGRMVRERLVTP
ncbi:MAG: ATP-binding protein, partial [Desulfobacterales bacterium]|nr:ATP-binding protein [Desulfobacterales bacterium]